jgi:hypothetical protein
VQLTPKRELRYGQDTKRHQVLGEHLLPGVHSVTARIIGGVQRDLLHILS